MKLVGSFAVMMFPDVLQWIMSARKTGRLFVEQGQASRNIFFRNGQVIACSSDDPSLLVGQFLLFHGRISEEQLREALKDQEHSGKNLGEILVKMGAIRKDQLMQAIELKAEETIHGIFDWEDAAFEFMPDIEPPDDTIEMELSVQAILLKGAHRADEMNRIRTVFSSRGMILEHTDKHPDASQIASPMASRIYNLINGKRTLSEIILRSHASEYMACTFLLRLYELGIICVKEIGSDEVEKVSKDTSIEKARLLLAHSEYDAAMRILGKMLDEEPANWKVRMMLAKAESSFVSNSYRNQLPPHSIPKLKAEFDQLINSEFSAEEYFLIDLIDGTWDVKSIVWIAPMRASQVLSILKSLLERGLIELKSDLPNGQKETLTESMDVSLDHTEILDKS